MTSSIAIINKTAPYGSSNAGESLDIAMIAGTFGQDVSLYFVDDGVFQLLKKQTPATKGVKSLSKMMGSLIFFDIENLYVCEKSMNERAIKREDLCVDTISLSPQELSSHLNKHSHVMVF